MKAGNQAVRAVCASRGFKLVFSLLFFLFLSGGNTLYGQCRMNDLVFSLGEKIYLDVYFKWGILMPKAGSAVISIDEVPFEGEPSIRQRLVFKTAPMFDRIYKMRDTIDTNYSMDMGVLQYEKRTEEGGYYLVDRMRFLYNGDSTFVPTIRYDRNRTKIDTTHVYEGCLFDMLGVTMYLRTLDMETMSIGDEFPTAIAMGRDVIKIKYRYAGQSIIERKDNLKYKTLRFYMDVYDDAFTQSKEALEIWVSDDENRLPIKIRAKLKIGAAEVYFNKVEGNRYPLESQIFIPRRY